VSSLEPEVMQRKLAPHCASVVHSAPTTGVESVKALGLGAVPGAMCWMHTFA
jgi:hypothetical protein